MSESDSSVSPSLGESRLSSPQVTNQAPSVAAVVVVSNPGPWFDLTLAALGKSDYPNLKVFVLEIGHSERHDAALHAKDMPTTAQRVQHAIPDAYFRTVAKHPGYSAAANQAVEALGDADYLLFVDDDAFGEPGAISAMVERAEATHGDLVAPKYVEWNRPEMVVSVGGGFDATGKYVPTIEVPELDQGQHDARHSAMATDVGFVLIRHSFFNSLGGFDPEIEMCGQMFDFCWRAAVAGQQVEIVSSARVRCMSERTAPSRNPSSAQFVSRGDDLAHREDVAIVAQRRNRARSVLKVHSGLQFFVVLFLQLLAVAGEIVWGLVTRRRVVTNAAIAAVTWNFVHWRSLAKAKLELEKLRKIRGADLRKSYTSVRRRWSEEFQFAWEQRGASLAERDFGSDFGRARRYLRRIPVLVGLAVFAVWLIGSRDLIGDPIAAIGSFTSLDTPVNSLRRFFLVWPAQPMGEVVPASPAHLILGVISALCLGATAFAQKVLILGAVPFGVWAMTRLARPLRTRGARFIAGLSYALVPVPYHAIGAGRFDVLVVYALAPVIVHRLMRLDGVDPFVYSGGAVHVGLRRRREDLEIRPLDEGNNVETETPRRRSTDQRDQFSFVVLRKLLPIGALLAVVGAFAPQALLGFGVIALCLALTHLPFGAVSARRLLAVFAGSSLLAIAMLLPAFLGNQGGWSTLWSVTGQQTTVAPRDLMFLGTGRGSFGWLSVGLFIAAFIGLLIARAWRFQLSVRLWIVLFVLMTVLLAGSNGFLGGFQPRGGIWFVLIAVVLSLMVANTTAALVYDKTTTPPWWRALGVRVGVVACVVALFIPFAWRAADGSWGLPKSSVAATASWMKPGVRAPLSSALDGDTNGSFRTLWLGAPNVIPGGSRDLGGINGAITYNSPIDTSPAPIQAGGAGQTGIARALQATAINDSVDLGSRLSPYGVRYVAVPVTSGPQKTSLVNDADRLTDRMNQQLDMRQVSSGETVRVWENALWKPIVPTALKGDDISIWRGQLDAGDYELLFASSPSWQLSVDGKRVARGAHAFGNSFHVNNGGNAELAFVASATAAVGQVVCATLWLMVFGVAIAYLPRRKQFA